MEYRIKDYSIKGNRILLPRQTGIEDLRLIYNETQKKLICSTATKDNVSLVQGEGGTLVEVPASVCVLKSTDLLTIKCDYGDEGANESSLNAAKAEIVDAVNNAKPDIDFTLIAKEETLSTQAAAILQAVGLVQEKLDASFTIGIVGKNCGKQNIKISGIVEKVYEGGKYEIAEDLLVTQDDVQNDYLMLNAGEIVDGYIVL